MAREIRFFGFRFQDKWVSARPSSFNSQSGLWQDAKKGGWQIMWRLIVLCLVFLSLLSYPGHACALDITGEVWLNAFASAENPALGPPKLPSNPNITAPANASFKVTDFNFDSLRFKNPQNVTFNEFLNITDPAKQWTIPSGSNFDPGSPMFNGMNGKEGIFFKFEWSMDVFGPIIITHDDGFQLQVVPKGITIDKYTSPVKNPEDAVIDLGLAPGNYSFTLSYGAINDTESHVLIIRTPEPGTLLLLGLGLVGIGLTMRKRL
jgi:hypothetical protein